MGNFYDRGSFHLSALFLGCCKIDSLNRRNHTRLSYIKYRKEPLRHGE